MLRNALEKLLGVAEQRISGLTVRLLTGEPGKKELRIPRLGMHTLLNEKLGLCEAWGGNQRVGQRHG